VSSLLGKFLLNAAEKYGKIKTAKPQKRTKRGINL
jgi:hypothetical protein